MRFNGDSTPVGTSVVCGGGAKLGVLALAALVALVAPMTLTAETLYLSCSNQELDEPIVGDDDNIVTKLYEVTLNEDTGEAELSEFAVSTLNQADAIACNQESRCYILDRLLISNPSLEDGGFIEEYIVGQPDPVNVSQTVLTEDTLGFPAPLQGLVLAAFHPDGTLYGGSQDDDRLYTIDLDLDNNLSNPTAEPVGLTGAILVDGAALDLEGADLVFTADQRGFVWTNGDEPGMYELFLPADNTMDATAVQLDEAGALIPPEFATGLAVRGDGAGNVVVSSTLDDMSEHDTGDGAMVQSFDMVEGDGFDHGSGDLANTFNCLMRCAPESDVVLPGETLAIDVELFHNSARTVNQEFTFEVLDAAGDVRFTSISPVFELRQGDQSVFSLPMPVPAKAEPGHYTIRIGVSGMQQGDLAAECEFEIGAPDVGRK